MIYLDYTASTPADEEVLNEFIKVTKENYANPNSNHELGHQVLNKINLNTIPLFPHVQLYKKMVLKLN